MRNFGMLLIDKTEFGYYVSKSEKLLIENHFEMSLATCINIKGYQEYHLEFKKFWQGGGNILNSLLVFIYSIYLPVMVIYSYVLMINQFNRAHVCTIEEHR